jgi:hypothetical protein
MIEFGVEPVFSGSENVIFFTAEQGTSTCFVPDSPLEIRDEGLSPTAKLYGATVQKIRIY